MTQAEMQRRALATSGATLLSFIGLVHEVAGPTLFPWAPPLFGPALWQAIGIGAMLLGALALAGTLQWLRVPVLPIALFVGLFGLGAFTVFALVWQTFHFFALVVFVAGLATAKFHRDAERLRRAREAQ